MKLPLAIGESLPESAVKTWKEIYSPTKGSEVDKTTEESLWRRTQSEANKSTSGWKDSHDKRRKILYYKHEHDVLEVAPNEHKLCLVSTCIYIALTLPSDELAEYREYFQNKLSPVWVKSDDDSTSEMYKYGDLELSFTYFQNPQDNIHEYTDFEPNYETFEVLIKSSNFKMQDNLYNMIWDVTKTGLRKNKVRENPTYTKEVADLLKYAPFQVEIGCGPAFEAGIFPLHTLHELYSINEPFTKKFIVSAAEDVFITGLCTAPLDTYKNALRFFYSIVTAETTEFYLLLKELHDKGVVVGPIITNNFDGMCLRTGLTEHFIRTYIETEVFPDINFDEKARSLLVIGCHADRRNVEELAHDRGLPVNYIDTEGWHVDGEFIDYLLESPKSSSLICRMEATKALQKIAELIDKE